MLFLALLSLLVPAVVAWLYIPGGELFAGGVAIIACLFWGTSHIARKSTN